MIDMGNLKNKNKNLPNHLVRPLKGEGLKDVDGSKGEEDKKLVREREYQRIWQQKNRFQEAQVLVEEQSRFVEEQRVLLECVDVTCSTFVSSFLKYGPRSCTTPIKTIIMFILDFLKGYDVAKQQATMHKVVSHELLIHVMLAYLQNVKRLKHNH